MVVIRFVLLLFVFICFNVRVSVAQPRQGMESMAIVVEKNEHHYLSFIAQRKSSNDVQAMIVERPAMLEGRKMVLKRVLNQKIVNENNLDGDQRQLLQNSGAAHFDVHFQNEGKLSSIKRSSSRPVKVQMDVAIPLDADYNIPRPHPPKNN